MSLASARGALSAIVFSPPPPLAMVEAFLSPDERARGSSTFLHVSSFSDTGLWQNLCASLYEQVWVFRMDTFSGLSELPGMELRISFHDSAVRVCSFFPPQAC